MLELVGSERPKQAVAERPPDDGEQRAVSAWRDGVDLEAPPDVDGADRPAITGALEMDEPLRGGDGNGTAVGAEGGIVPPVTALPMRLPERVSKSQVRFLSEAAARSPSGESRTSNAA